MSGLVRFFRTFFPSDPVSDIEVEDNDESELEAAEATAYRESISSYSSVRSIQHSAKSNSHTDNHNDNHNTIHKGCSDNNNNNNNNKLPSPMDDFSDEEDDTTCTYQEWKLQRNIALTAFTVKRLARQDDESDNDMENQDNDNQTIEEEQTETQRLETQPVEDVDPEFLDSPVEPKPHRTLKKVPHVDDTLHDVTNVSGMDLYTKSLSLDLCKVERVWKLRETRRFENMTCFRNMPLSDDPTIPLAVSPFGYSEDDGPLQTVFKTVLSMEVTQLEDPHLDKIRHTSLLAFSNAKLYRRVKIFFHNKYAAAIQAFLEGGTHTRQIMISLQNIPAKCILPYYANRESFLDQDIAKYCIIIGDKSSLKLLQVEGGQQKIHFQDDTMEIQLAMWDDNGQKVERIFNSTTVKDQGQGGHITATALINKYDAWFDLHQKDRLDPAVLLEEVPTVAPVLQQTPPRTKNVCQREPPPLRTTGTTRLANTIISGRSPKRIKSSMHYHNLVELEDTYNSRIDSKFLSVNVISVVLGFGAPSLTKRNHWMISMSIIDDTLPLPGNSLPIQDINSFDDSIAVVTLCVFANRKEDLPDVRQAGDVLRLKCVGVQVYNNQMQLLATTGRESSITVIRPIESADGIWQFEASPEGIHEAVEVERYKKLWEWGQQRMFIYPTMRTVSCFKIADVGRTGVNAETGKQDATVMVASMFESPTTQSDYPLPRGFLRIWDGTGDSQSDNLPIATSAANQAVFRGEPPSEVIEYLAKVIQDFNKDDEDSIEPPKSLCGKVTNIAIWEDAHWNFVKKNLRPGNFVRLRNISQGQLFHGLNVLFAQSKSWLTPIPGKTFEVGQLLRDHNHRVRCRQPFNPQCGVLPLEWPSVQNEDMTSTGPVPPQSREVSESVHNVHAVKPTWNAIDHCIREPAPKLFVGVCFKVTKFSPSLTENTGLTSLCVNDKNGGKRYQFVVHLEDNKAEIGAFAADAVGHEFFGCDAATAHNLDPNIVYLMVNSIQQSRWTGDIRSTELKGAKYFILQSVSKLDQGSV